MTFRIAELKDTTELMLSEDYKERFKAEYYQTKMRYNKLKRFNARIEVSRRFFLPSIEPKHDCPAELLLEQEYAMGDYLHILEQRAAIEGIEL